MALIFLTLIILVIFSMKHFPSQMWMVGWYSIKGILIVGLLEFCIVSTELISIGAYFTAACLLSCAAGIAWSLTDKLVAARV